MVAEQSPKGRGGAEQKFDTQIEFDYAHSKSRYRKVLVRKTSRTTQKDTTISQGSHDLVGHDLLGIRDSERCLVHFPIRTLPQWHLKMSGGVASLEKSDNLPAGAGGHWRKHLDSINNLTNQSELRRLAMCYPSLECLWPHVFFRKGTLRYEWVSLEPAVWESSSPAAKKLPREQLRFSA